MDPTNPDRPISQLAYAEPAASVGSIQFQEDGDSLHVVIPQMPAWWALATLGISLVIVFGFAAGLFALGYNFSRGRLGEIIVIAGSYVMLAFAVFSLIRRMVLVAAFGRRPMVLTFGSTCLIVDSPRDYGDEPRKYELNELETIDITVERTASLALQVTFHVTPSAARNAKVTFISRDQAAVKRLISLTREFASTITTMDQKIASRT
jgi:hypothetical protein